MPMSEHTPGKGERENGRYIHRERPNGMPGTRVLTLDGFGEHREWVHADDFMDVQKERDDYRRTLALINAMTVAEHNRRLRKLLDAAGFTLGDASAMRSLIEWATPRGEQSR